MHDERVMSFDDVSDWLSIHGSLSDFEGFKILSGFQIMIDDADVHFWKDVHEDQPGVGRFKTLELTTSGREVGGDSPRWWVFSGEPDVTALWNDTKVAFLAAQSLLRDSEKIKRRRFTSYSELVDSLAHYLNKHEHELKALETYAGRLAEKHELAPAILFSYSVWGSTRRADRSLDGKGQSDPARFQCAGELALGLRRRTWPLLYHVWLEALDDAHEAASSDEDYLWVTREELFERAEHDIKSALVEYFTGVRDSLRHIDLLCQEAKQRDDIYASDEFLSLLLTKVTTHPTAVETDLWDIKETLDMWSCPREKRDAAAVTFVEDVAAFANKRGGVLIIGITDRTRQIIGVPDIENRIKHIESVLRSRIDYSGDFFRVRSVQLAGSACIVVVVGQTAAPVGVRQVNNSYTYPVRVGPSIEREPRADVYRRKLHMKGTSFAFAAELGSWVGM